jgi:hypothetical protein
MEAIQHLKKRKLISKPESSVAKAFILGSNVNFWKRFNSHSKAQAVSTWYCKTFKDPSSTIRVYEISVIQAILTSIEGCISCKLFIITLSFT